MTSRLPRLLPDGVDGRDLFAAPDNESTEAYISGRFG